MALKVKAVKCIYNITKMWKDKREFQDLPVISKT